MESSSTRHSSEAGLVGTLDNARKQHAPILKEEVRVAEASHVQSGSQRHKDGSSKGQRKKRSKQYLQSPYHPSLRVISCPMAGLQALAQLREALAPLTGQQQSERLLGHQQSLHPSQQMQHHSVRRKRRSRRDHQKCLQLRKAQRECRRCTCEEIVMPRSPLFGGCDSESPASVRMLPASVPSPACVVLRDVVVSGINAISRALNKQLLPTHGLAKQRAGMPTSKREGTNLESERGVLSSRTGVSSKANGLEHDTALLQTPFKPSSSGTQPISLVLVSSSTEPPILIQHLPELCARAGVPLFVSPDIQRHLGAIVGLPKAAALALRIPAPEHMRSFLPSKQQTSFSPTAYMQVLQHLCRLCAPQWMAPCVANLEAPEGASKVMYCDLRVESHVANPQRLLQRRRKGDNSNQ